MAKTAVKRKPAAKRAGAGKAKPAAKKAAPKKTAAARKPAAKKAPAGKAAAKRAPAKKAPARRPAAKKPVAKAKPRSAKLRATQPRAAKPAAKPARRPQRFMLSHYLEQEFKRDGLRPYAMYRELGVADATGGLAQAHVIRLIPPCDPEEVSKLHYHDVDFQLVYVLKGWMKSEFEGQGEQFMRAGSAWIQPPGIKHKVLDYSDDCEVLEIILPAQFDTVTLE